MKKSMKEFQALVTQSKKVHILQGISHLLEWDQETYMPKEGHGPRAEQIELMALITHRERTHPTFEKNLKKLIDLKTGKFKGTFSLKEKACLREWRRDLLHSKALPETFVKNFAKLSSESITVWTKARQNNDFPSFLPYLEKIIDLSKKKADLLGYKAHPYDALLDLYEPDLTTKEVITLFKKLKENIIPLIRKIAKRPQIEESFLHGKFAKEKILEFSHELLQAIGYDFLKGRLDLSTHPFSTSFHPNDSRITTRIHNDSLFDPLSGVLHEAGHSLYEMGMDPEFFGTPLAEPVSLGIHESQSRIWETRIGQSLPFWQAFLPELKKYFPKLKNVSLQNFYAAVNRVQPSFIRVEADEVTYSLHVIIRFELEKKLIEGSLPVADLPEAWNALVQEYLGITPKTDAMGCLQDIHWSMGAFGYFPTYTIGNLYASQFFDTFEKAYPDWETRVSKGEILFFREWLRENIHIHGKTYRAKELLKKVTGKNLSVSYYLAYLNRKYKELYSL